MNTFLFEELLRSRVAKSKTCDRKAQNLPIFLIEKRCLTSDINVSEMIRGGERPKIFNEISALAGSTAESMCLQ